MQLAELSEGSSHNPISGEPPWASSATSEVGFGHDDAAAASLGKVVEVQAEISSMSSGGADDVLVAEISSLSSGGGLGVDEADGDEAAHGGDSSLKGGQEVRESVEVGGCTDANDASSPGHSDGQDAPLINPKIGGRRRKRGFLVGAVVAPKAGHPVSPLPVSGGASGPGDAGRGMHVSLAPQSPSPTLPSDASGSSHPESPADNLKHLSPRPPPGAVLM